MIIFFQKKEDQVFTTSHFDARDTKKYGYLAMTMLLPSYFYDLTSCGIWDFEMLFASISISIVYFEAKFSFEEISQINIAVIRKGICYFYFHKHTLRKCTYILLLIYVCVYYYLCILMCSAWWRSIYSAISVHTLVKMCLCFTINVHNLEKTYLCFIKNMHTFMKMYPYFTLNMYHF